MGPGAVLRVVVACFALVTALPSAASANCSISASQDYVTVARSEWSGSIDTAIIGTIVEANGPQATPTFVIRVDEHVAGVSRDARRITRSGAVTCGWFRLPVGKRYLIAYASTARDLDGALIIETDGPAWRSIVWDMAPVYLDRRLVPVEPARLKAFLRSRLASLPPTDALDSVPAAPPMETAWLAIPGALGAGWWLLAARRRRRAVDLVG